MRQPVFPYLSLPEKLNNSGGVPYVLYTSPDGYRWNFEAETNHREGPFCDFVAPDQMAASGSDGVRVRWDSKLGKYIANCKHRIGPDHRFSPIFHGARVVGQLESDDLIHWGPSRVIAYPDGEDAKTPLNGMHGIYEGTVIPTRACG